MQRSSYINPHYGLEPGESLHEMELPFFVTWSDLHGKYPYRYLILMIATSAVWLGSVIGVIALMNMLYLSNSSSRDAVSFGYVVVSIIIYSILMSRLSKKITSAHRESRILDQEQLAEKFTLWFEENRIEGGKTAALQLIRNGNLIVPNTNTWGAHMLEFTPYGYKLQHQSVLIWKRADS